MSATELAKELANIHHFHLDHYAPSLPPKFCIIIFLLGITVIPRQKEDTGYTKFWGRTWCIMVYVKMVNC